MYFKPPASCKNDRPVATVYRHSPALKGPSPSTCSHIVRYMKKRKEREITDRKIFEGSARARLSRRTIDQK